MKLPAFANSRRRVCASATLLMSVSVLLSAPIPAAAAPPDLPPLTTVSRSPRLPGKFIWADLVTDDARAAQKFYSALFGWKFYDYGGYLIGMNDDRPMCGMFQKPRPADNPEARPRWMGFISVENVGRARDAVIKAGGRVLAPPGKYPKRGEQAVFADPEGALFGVVKSSAGDPEDFLPDPGDWIWVQLLSRDAGKAAEFYRSVAGYEIVESAATNRVTDFVLTSNGYARATVRSIPAQRAQMQPNWLPFVRVKNIGAAVAQAKQLGGKALLEPGPDLLQGRAAVVADPTGAAIGLLEWNPDEAKGAR